MESAISSPLLPVKSEQGELKTRFLHEDPALLIPCCELLNDEWPRSLTARLTLNIITKLTLTTMDV